MSGTKRRSWKKRLPWIIVILVVLYPWTDLLFRDRWFLDEGTVPVGFETLSGRIGITFSYRRNGTDFFRYVRYVEGQVQHPNRLPQAHYKAVVRNANGPMATSPDGRYLAAGTDKAGTWNIAPVFVIIDLKTNREIVRIDSSDAWGVQSVGWSPAGDRIAVLRSESVWGKSPLELISHPNQLDTYYLDIVDVKGNVTASTMLASRVSNLRGEVTWTE